VIWDYMVTIFGAHQEGGLYCFEASSVQTLFSASYAGEQTQGKFEKYGKISNLGIRDGKMGRRVKKERAIFCLGGKEQGEI